MFADTQISRYNQTKCQRCFRPHTLLWQHPVESDCVGGGSMQFVVSLELFLLSCFHDTLTYMYPFRNLQMRLLQLLRVHCISG